MQQAALERLCAQVGVPTDTAQRIVQGLVASLTPAPEASGEAAGPPLRPARLADLAWLGIEPATLARLEPFVDLLPAATPVNLNTAPREVMVAAIDGIDLGSAERLVQARQRTPLRSLDEVRSQLPPGTVLEPGDVYKRQALGLTTPIRAKRASLAGTGSGSATGAGAVAPSRRLRSPRSAAPGSATSACGGTGKGRLASFSPQNSALPATRAQITRVHQRADMRRLSSTHSPQSVRTGPPPLP